MSALIERWRNLVIANRILAREGVVDAFGHVSVRHPDNPDRYLMSRSRSPELVSFDDIMEFELDGTPIDRRDRPIYAERPIHGAVFEARPDVQCVIHNHAYELIPFSVTGTPIRPLLHTAARIGAEVPIWDIADRFGDTNLLVTDMEAGRDLAKTLGAGRAAPMRGHGCVVAGGAIQDAVMTAIYLMVNARLQAEAMRMGEIRFLSPGEIAKFDEHRAAQTGYDRPWQWLSARAGCENM